MGVKQVATTNGFRLGLDWSNPPENIDDASANTGATMRIR